MKGIRIFVDSDVVISSLISSSGAAYLLMNLKKKNLKFFISNISQKELRIVSRRLKIKPKNLEKLIKNRFGVIILKENNNNLRQKFIDYVWDPNDAHIIAGAAKLKANFLLTYNGRHYRKERIKKDFNILTLTPAIFLQYLRSQKEF